MDDFEVSKFKFYNGPNLYLDRKAMVFNLHIKPEGRTVAHYEAVMARRFPEIEEKRASRVVDLFADVLVWVLKMDIDLYINNTAISRDGEDFVLAVDYLDKRSAEDSAVLVRDWFRAVDEGREFDFETEFTELQKDFDRTLFGGPTIYSLIEAGMKRDIPVNFLFEENQFQWGYGKKQIRGRSTTLHTDSIKDTEFTMYKDIVKDFLLMCGFPTPVGRNCMTADQAQAEAQELGWPVVVKPLAGHKGQGVTTGVASKEQLKAAFNNVVDGADAEGVAFQGAIVEKEIFGTDHRLLSVGGKFAAGLERVPAYVDGNGTDTIRALIEVENAKAVRLDNARSPLCKINIDDDLKAYLALQNLSVDSVPEKGEQIYLRRVANISQGGVSINVTDKVHPKNVQLVENIARFFDVTCLGIDVLAEDISAPWDESSFGIIEINAGPGVFMHLAPALGGSIDVPGQIMKVYYPQPQNARIPIITGNRLSLALCTSIYAALKTIKADVQFGCLTPQGVYFNGRYFCKNKDHDQNVKILLREPRLDFAAIAHGNDDILDFGTWHQGADMAILENAHDAETILERDLLPEGVVIKTEGRAVHIFKDGERSEIDFPEGTDMDRVLAEAIQPFLARLLVKYD